MEKQKRETEIIEIKGSAEVSYCFYNRVSVVVKGSSWFYKREFWKYCLNLECNLYGMGPFL